MPDSIADQIKLLGVRLSFPDLFKAKSVQKDGEPKFGAAFLLDKERDAEQIKTIKKLIALLAIDKFGEKAVEMIKKGKIKICLHEGSDKEYDGYNESNMFLTASSKKRPAVVDKDRTPLAEEDQKPYAGCYVNAVIRLWAQDNEFGKRVNAELQGVQFAKDGDPFGAAPFNPDDHFEVIGEGSKKASSDASGAADEDEIPF